jgi:hypothetical protein
MPDSPQPKKVRQVRNNVKSMLICFFWYWRIMHKEFVPPGQTVNGHFYCDVRRCLRKKSGANVQSSGATIPGPCTMTTRPPTRHSLCGSFWLQQKTTVIPHPPYSPDHAPCDFFLFPKMKLKLQGRRFENIENFRTWWRCWRRMTSSSASDHGNPAGIAILTQKGTTSKEMEANKNFDKWWSLGQTNFGNFWVCCTDQWY